MKIPEITPGRVGASLGAAWMAGLLLYLGLPPTFGAGFVVICLLLVSISALFGLGAGLAVQHISLAPGVLWRPAVFLVPVSLLILWSHWQERRGVPEMVARADSARGAVLGENVFGNLLVYYRYPDAGGRLVAPRKHAHRLLGEGDSIWVYVDRKPPHRFLDVWPAGPDWRAMVRLLFWLWVFGGVILVGYGPLMSRRLAKPLRKSAAAAAEPTAEPSTNSDAG
ncbi:MAG TPA: hypothetical protein VF584_17270 [Longimicrobium sp.]|jgi:hypothetical protein